MKCFDQSLIAHWRNEDHVSFLGLARTCKSTRDPVNPKCIGLRKQVMVQQYVEAHLTSLSAIYCLFTVREEISESPSVLARPWHLRSGLSGQEDPHLLLCPKPRTYLLRILTTVWAIWLMKVR